MRNGSRQIVMAVLLVGLGLGGGALLEGQAQVANSQALTPTAIPAGQASSQTQLFRSIYAKVNPSVVSIQVQLTNQQTTAGFGQQSPNQGLQKAAGSGFVYDTAGHIVTNAHVVQNATNIEVTFSDGNTMRATVKGIDLDSDLAVLQVQGNVSQYAPVTLANSDEIQVGDQVVAIGNPFEEAGTMTNGIVSALHRTVQGLHTNGNGSYSIPNAIQTDAAVNPGNSGGPLLNESGQVIGVNEQIEAPAGQSSGISFSIPSNLVQQVVPELIQKGQISHSYLGVSSVSLTLDIDAALKLPENTRGALITDVSADSPAAKAGMQAARVNNNGVAVRTGDVITAINNQQIRSADDLIAYLFTKTTVGQTLKITVLRNGQSQDLSVQLAARPN